MSIVVSNPDVQVTGSVHHFVNTLASSVPVTPTATATYYLGTCETQPQIDVQRMALDVFNDIGGRSIPFQQIYEGEVAVVGLLLTRWSQLAYNAVRDPGQAISGNSSITPGQDSEIGGRGTLMFNRINVRLWQLFDFYGTSIAQTNLPPGRYWPNAQLAAHKIVDSGTAAEKLLLVFNCIPIYNTSTRGFQFYSEAVADFTDGTNTINRAAIQ
jgi:hypothetical protein